MLDRATLVGLLTPANNVSVSSSATAQLHGPVPAPSAPVPAPERTLLGAGADTAASGGSSASCSAVAALDRVLGLNVPRLSCPFQGIQELGAPVPFVLLLDRPG
jgi:hypothetical protein